MEKQGINILLVAGDEQDYINIRRLLSEIEENTPFDGWISYLEWVRAYDSACKMITRSRHDVYLIDAAFNTYEKEGGLGLVRWAVSEGTKAPLVLLSDSPYNPTSAQAIAVGAMDYLLKGQLNSFVLERSLRYAIKSKEIDVLQQSHDTLKQWARRRTATLKKINLQLRQEAEGRQHTETALKQSEEKYRTLIDNIQDGVFLVKDGRIEFSNEAFARMLGYSVSDIVGLKFLDLISRDDLAMIATQYGQMELKPGVPKEYEFNLLHKDQKTRVMVNINLGAFRYKNRTASIGTVKDITVRKYTEEELRKLSRVVHQNPISIVITSLNGSIEYVNPVFTELTGYSLQDVIGETPRILKSGEHPPEFYEDLWQTISSGRTWRGELHNRRKDGELFWEYATIAPITDKDGQTTHYMAILEDITERKAVLAELEQHRHHLEELVEERTKELQEANQRLQQEIEERERLTEVTRQGRERLRLQYNGIPLPTYTFRLREQLPGKSTYTWQRVGRDFVLIDYNDAASKAIDGRIIDYMGKKASDMFADKSHILEDFKKCFITKKMIQREGPYQLLTTGETKYYITSYIPIPPNIVMVHMEDITKYKQTEQKLNETREQLSKLQNMQANQLEDVNRQLQADAEAWQQDMFKQVTDELVKLPIEQSVVGTWAWNVATGEMEFSSEWAEMLGYTPEEVQKNIRSWAGLMHLDDIAKVMDNLNSHFAGETPFYEAEHRLRTKNGTWRWILGQGKVIERDKNGRVLRMTGVHRDISERKLAEEALRSSHSWFQSLIETVSDCVWELDRDMTYTYVSPKVVDILGFAPEEVIGRKPFEFMPPDEAKRLKAVFTRRVKSRKPLISIESTNLRKDGRQIVLETNGMPYFDEDGLFCGYRGAHQDVSRRKQG